MTWPQVHTPPGHREPIDEAGAGEVIPHELLAGQGTGVGVAGSGAARSYLSRGGTVRSDRGKSGDER